MYQQLLLCMVFLGLAGCNGAPSPTKAAPDPIVWEALEHPLGRGYVLTRNSVRNEGGFTLRLDPIAANGGQFRTVQRYTAGSFEVDIRCPRAPGSICAFFLYEDRPGDVADEIDIEIFNDGSRRALLVTWVHGVVTNRREVTLPFDPAESWHTYRIDHQPERIAFFVDGVEYVEFTSRLPLHPMHVYINAWYPTWLEPADAVDPVMRVGEFRFVL